MCKKYVLEIQIKLGMEQIIPTWTVEGVTHLGTCPVMVQTTKHDTKEKPEKQTAQQYNPTVDSWNDRKPRSNT